MTIATLKRSTFDSEKKQPFNFVTLRQELDERAELLLSLSGMDYEFEFSAFRERLSPLADHTLAQYVKNRKVYAEADWEILKANLLGECLLIALSKWQPEKGRFLDFWHLICKRHLYNEYRKKISASKDEVKLADDGLPLLELTQEKTNSFQNSELAKLLADILTNDMTPHEAQILIALQLDDEERKERLEELFGAPYGPTQRKRVERLRKKFKQKLADKGYARHDFR